MGFYHTYFFLVLRSLAVKDKLAILSCFVDRLFVELRQKWAYMPHIINKLYKLAWKKQSVTWKVLDPPNVGAL